MLHLQAPIEAFVSAYRYVFSLVYFANGAIFSHSRQTDLTDRKKAKTTKGKRPCFVTDERTLRRTDSRGMVREDIGNRDASR